MPDDGSPLSVTLTIVERRGQWFIELLNKPAMGPYYSAVLALQVAAAEMLAARKRGEAADIFIYDDYGHLHKCPLVDSWDDPDRCLKCQNLWQGGAQPLPPRCLLRAAIATRRSQED